MAGTVKPSKEKQPLPLLEFKNVTIIKGNYKKILDAVSVTIHGGENVAILGPNGAGKSSFIKAITREHYPVPEGKQFSFKIWGQENWDVFDLRNRLGIVTNGLQHVHTREISGMDISFIRILQQYRVVAPGCNRQDGKKSPGSPRVSGNRSPERKEDD